MDEFMSYEEYLTRVKEGIVTDLGNCPVTPLLLMLQGKWKTQILYELCIHDTVRFGVLKKELPGITNTMLTNALRELEADGFVHREQFNEIPPHVEYSFTERGRDLMPVFYEIMRWGSSTRRTNRKKMYKSAAGMFGFRRMNAVGKRPARPAEHMQNITPGRQDLRTCRPGAYIRVWGRLCPQELAPCQLPPWNMDRYGMILPMAVRFSASIGHRRAIGVRTSA